MIHSTAIVDATAELADDVTVGPYAVIGAGVKVGAGTQIDAHVVIDGPTEIGEGNHIFPHASIGQAPQDKKYAGEPTRLKIGDRNTIREFCTLNRGTTGGGGLTSIGDDNWLMAYTHIAHDCHIGNQVIFANCSTLAGHVTIDDWVILGGMTAVHQFCRVGAHSFCGHGGALVRDLPPYVMASGYPLAPRGINKEGLKRRGFDADQIKDVLEGYRILYRRDLKLDVAKAELAQLAVGKPHIAIIVEFLDRAERGLVR